MTYYYEIITKKTFNKSGGQLVDERECFFCGNKFEEGETIAYMQKNTDDDEIPSNYGQIRDLLACESCAEEKKGESY